MRAVFPKSQFSGMKITLNFQECWWILGLTQKRTAHYWKHFWIKNFWIPSIALLYHNSNYITCFKEKPDLSNQYLVWLECTLVNNSIIFPTDFSRKTRNFLSTSSLSKDDIAKIIRNLYSSKVLHHDMDSIRMLEICGEIW